MPFNNEGVYTPPDGAINAVPGQVIRSATWNAIFNDISSALSLLGEQLYGTTTVSASPYVPDGTDTLLLVNVASAVVINLPTSASRDGYPIRIKDISGLAPTNNITINANGAELIEGEAAITIDVAFGGFNLFPVSSGWIILP